jgi:hypothetical protein
MRIHAESRVHHPTDQVYETYRDHLPALVRYLDDVREIVVHSREEADGVVKLHNEWFASTEIPSLAQSIIRPDMLRWEDRATWDDGALHADWVLTIPAFRRQVTCRGRNAFFADGPGATRVVLTGELEIDARNIPGVPRLLAKRIAPKIEAFIVKMVTPNLVKVNESLERYLDEQA